MRSLAKMFIRFHKVGGLRRPVSKQAPVNQDRSIPELVVEDMHHLLEWLRLTLPDEVTVQSMDSFMALLHLQVLAWLANQLSQRQ